MAVVAAPCGTSPIIPPATFFVHTLGWRGSYSSAINSATASTASTNTYNFAIHAFGLAILFTYSFRTLFILSTLYIYRMCMDPHSSSSYTRYRTKCDITSRKLKGMWISNIDIVTAMSFLRLGMSSGSTTLAQILLGTRDSLMIAMWGSCCSISFMHNGNNCCITTCQSCAIILNFLVVISMWAESGKQKTETK